MVKTPSSRPKSSRKKAPAASTDAGPAIEPAIRLDEKQIRERAYGIWIAEGRPHGRDLAHWQRARHELLEGAR
jgi:hypothetical protein